MWVSHHVGELCLCPWFFSGSFCKSREHTPSHCHVPVVLRKSAGSILTRHVHKTERRNLLASRELIGRREAGWKVLQKSKWVVFPREESVRWVDRAGGSLDDLGGWGALAYLAHLLDTA